MVTPSTTVPSSAPTGSGSTPRPRREIPPWLIVTVAVAIAVVVVVGGLALSGKFGPSSASQLGSSPTFAGAVSEAQPAANAINGGPWQAAFGAAIRIPSPLQFSTQNLSQIVSSLGCTPTLIGVPPESVVVEATPASSGPGTSAFWIVGFTSTSGTAVGVMVSEGNPTALFELTPTSCSKVTGSLLPFPGGAADSSTVVATVNTGGGSAFLSTHPNASQVYFGVGGYGLLAIEPVWEVSYDSCPLALIANTSGFEFNATVEGTTLAEHSTGPVTCVALSSLSIPTLARRSGGPQPLGKAI